MPGAVREKLKPAQSYGLTVEERAALENVVRQAYTVPEAAQILTVTAGRTATGSIVACGTANARRSDGTMSEARLFRAEGVPTAWGVPDFQLKQMAAANASSIEVYAACRDLGLV
ncbi:hypothetical protein [Consotaella salsifontis]|uniref:Uncharacterized protein n=1 Tax=Consotaella salsifontis TaxID=1365950 RepID=A0A1T4L672_9HYPH|nr:hypothetical protein [Consotaella salsifontis]SJZ50226.1 hypothetical protein SAMN05428963_10177 [Consotaella salsifontis]